MSNQVAALLTRKERRKAPEAELMESGVLPNLDEVDRLWKTTVDEVLQQATLSIPENGWEQVGGRQGRHSEHLGYLLAEMQYMQRTYPGMEW